MISTLGRFSLVLALGITLYGAFVSILGAYLLAAVGLLCYLVSVSRRTRAMTAQLAALTRRAGDGAR